MLIDKYLTFGLPVISGNSATNGTDVYDASSAVKLFGGPEVGRLRARSAFTAGTSPTFKMELVGSDAAALNSGNIVLATTGIVDKDKDGNALVNGDVVDIDIPIPEQRLAKRYYGIIVTLGGTTPGIAADASQGYVVAHGDTRAPT